MHPWLRTTRASILVANLVLNVGQVLVACEAQHASAEPASDLSGSHHAIASIGNLDESVDGGTSDLEVVPLARMRITDQATEQTEIALRQGLERIQNPLILSNDMAGATIKQVAKLIPGHREHSHIDITQSTNFVGSGQYRHGIFTFSCSIIVTTVRQLMSHAAVYDK